MGKSESGLWTPKADERINDEACTVAFACRTFIQPDAKEIAMDKVQFVYETYISTTPEELWNALIDPKITAKYWERENVSDWHPGSRWEHRSLDEEHRVDLVGKVVEFSPPSRLVLT